ncbi:MAG: hypothetical protein KDA17_02810 [Candidatus Saccharibacteria bacterium]|nr:hypothetical protein [Candidatus Saccharibacteria bacterium]
MPTWTEETAKENEDRRRHSALEKFKADEILAAINGLYESPEGRSFLTYLIFGHGAVGLSPFTEDERSTAFFCGKQSLGHELFALCSKANPQLFAELMKEHFDEHHTFDGNAGGDSDRNAGGVDGSADAGDYD